MDDVASPLTLVSDLGRPRLRGYCLHTLFLLSLGDALLTTVLCDALIGEHCVDAWTWYLGPAGSLPHGNLLAHTLGVGAVEGLLSPGTAPWSSPGGPGFLLPGAGTP